MMVRLAILSTVGAIATAGGVPQTVPSMSLYIPAPSSSTTERDYVIDIDGAVVPPIRLTRAPHALSVIVLRDVSNSMRAEPLTALARRLADRARPGDSIRLATFSDRILIAATPIVDRASAEKAAQEVTQPAGASRLWDGIGESLDALRSTEGLRAVVILSDGRASANDRGFDETFDLAIRSGVILSVVGLAERAERFPSEMIVVGRNEGLQRLARGTGGTYAELRTQNASGSSAILDALNALRGRARLEFVPPVRDGAVHRVSITLRGHPVPVPMWIQF